MNPGTTIECTAGTARKPCRGIFRTPSVGEVARVQWAAIGWTQAEVPGGGIGYRCPIHTRLEPAGALYAYRPMIEAQGDAQLDMSALGVSSEAPVLMHDDAGGPQVARKSKGGR